MPWLIRSCAVCLTAPLISYILIFTFLSLFESGVSIIQAPIYYFGWGLAFVGIILALSARLGGFWKDLQAPSSVSAQILLPLALFISVAMAPTQGVGQLGVSLLLAAAFYGLEALNAATYRVQNAVTAHILAL